jgi:hypothetical protein
MARELGPQGIHVAHVIVDGAIDTQFIAENFLQRYQLKARDGILNPDAIAQTYRQLHYQPRSSWAHELDLRPWTEQFQRRRHGPKRRVLLRFRQPGELPGLHPIAANRGRMRGVSRLATDVAGGVFKATGNSSPVSVPAKGRWMFDDLNRWARRYGVLFAHNPHFPLNTPTPAWLSRPKPRSSRV